MVTDINKTKNGLMVDVEIAITRVLPWKLDEKHIKEAMKRIREIILPAMENDDYKIREQAREIMCNEETIQGLEGAVAEAEAEEIDREEEAEYQELVALFNRNCLIGKAGG